jgi:hypothetical protein
MELVDHVEREIAKPPTFSIYGEEIHDALIGEMRHVYESDDTPGACRLFFLASIF